MTIKDKGLAAYQIRNELKEAARLLMKDQTAAEWLDMNEPPKSLRSLIQKAYNRNFVGDNTWEYVIESAQRTRKEVDAALELTRINHGPKL
ncbi:MAG: hypothetical protein H0W64_04910 [Gammaproteobacteria bacterium]|nr:hypothetical protein [Gammaproteobacteria bacterium]